jgi:hypothetical protein
MWCSFVSSFVLTISRATGLGRLYLRARACARGGAGVTRCSAAGAALRRERDTRPGQPPAVQGGVRMRAGGGSAGRCEVLCATAAIDGGRESEPQGGSGRGGEQGLGDRRRSNPRVDVGAESMRVWGGSDARTGRTRAAQARSRPLRRMRTSSSFQRPCLRRERVPASTASEATRVYAYYLCILLTPLCILLYAYCDK